MSNELNALRVWELQLQRVTLFRLLEGELTAETVWEALTGSTPTLVAGKPATKMTSATGPFGKGELKVQVDPARIDFIHTGTGSEGSPVPQSLGLASDQIGPFIEPIAGWLKTGPAALRMAYGCLMTQDVESVRDANACLQPLLPDVRIDVEHSTDFQYRINRPCLSSAVADLKINRLAKWGTRKIVVGKVSPTDIGNAVPISESHQAFCELDVNSDARWRSRLSNGDLSPLLYEMRSMAEEIGISGDIP